MQVQKLNNGLQIITHDSGRQFVVPDPKPHPAPDHWYRYVMSGVAQINAQKA